MTRTESSREAAGAASGRAVEAGTERWAVDAVAGAPVASAGGEG
jgi:hypothetical protein